MYNFNLTDHCIFSKGCQFNATKMVFFVVDGQTDLVTHLTEVQELKYSGVQIFVVAVGSYIKGVDALVNVASSPPEQFLFRVESLEGFLHATELAVEQVYSCKWR